MSRALVVFGDLGTAAAHILWLLAFSALLLPPTLNLFAQRLEDGGEGEGPPGG